MYPGAAGFGHVGIGINQSATDGYYPKAASARMVTGTPGEAKPDTREAKGCETIETSSDADKKMQDFIDQTKSNPGTYSLTGNNCVNFVRQTLLQGGVSSPDTFYPRPFFNGLSGSSE